MYHRSYLLWFPMLRTINRVGEIVKINVKLCSITKKRDRLLRASGSMCRRRYSTQVDEGRKGCRLCRDEKMPATARAVMGRGEESLLYYYVAPGVGYEY